MAKDFKALGGRRKLEEFSKAFYDKVYAHPWIGRFFERIDQEVIEKQQVDFLQSSLGGEKVYCGKFPIPAHKHMFITAELFEVRSALVKEPLLEVNANQNLVDAILKIDQAFKAGLVKVEISDCEKRFTTDELLIFLNPEKKIAS